MDSLRIAWLLPSVFFYWQPSLKELAQLIPQTTVFTSSWYGPTPETESALTVKLVGKLKVIKLTQSSTGYGSEFTYLSPSILGPLLQFKPHVIFSNSFGVWTILALFLKPLGKWRVVIAYEGSSPSVDYRNSPLRLWLRRLMVRLADACITNSRAGRAYLTEILNAPPDSVFVQPYEVPDPKALSGYSEDVDQSQLRLNSPVFLFVGHIVPRKGLHLLLEACAVLQQQGCDRYTLLVVGDGAQREELESLIKTYRLGDRVQWTGRVEYSHLGAYFHQADVFILPTLEDTWGVVVQEAMILGKPVLCSKRAGAAELITPGENGFVFDPEQPDQLAQLMRQFIEDPSLSRLMGEKSQQAMTHHTPTAAGKFLAQVAEFAWGDRVQAP
jgi:glycosyltransferase involved in cell wall biosynthesis